MKSLGECGPGIIIVVNKFSLLTRRLGWRLLLINKMTQQSSVFCLNSWKPSHEADNAMSLSSKKKPSSCNSLNNLVNIEIKVNTDSKK